MKWSKKKPKEYAQAPQTPQAPQAPQALAEILHDLETSGQGRLYINYHSKWEDSWIAGSAFGDDSPTVSAKGSTLDEAIKNLKKEK